MKTRVAFHHILIVLLAFMLLGASAPSFLPDNHSQQTPPILNDLQSLTADEQLLSGDDTDYDKFVGPSLLNALADYRAILPLTRIAVIERRKFTSHILTRAPPGHH